MTADELLKITELTKERIDLMLLKEEIQSSSKFRTYRVNRQSLNIDGDLFTYLRDLSLTELQKRIDAKTEIIDGITITGIPE